MTRSQHGPFVQVTQLTPADRERIRHARDQIVRERELHRGPDGKWRLTSGGYRRR